ncbi:hypothetical protein R6Q59_019465 [Mikania micrantha]
MKTQKITTGKIEDINERTRYDRGEIDVCPTCFEEMLKDKVALELIWSRAMELCNSISLSYFLKRHGRLAFVCFHQGLAVVELKFHHPDYASKADKSWKLIASALHVAMGCNVEIMICHSDNPKIKKSSFSDGNAFRTVTTH